MELSINHHKTNQMLDEALEEVLEKIALTALHEENWPDNTEISLVFTDDEGIRELNNLYRHKDAVTDVLSFPMYNNKSEVPALQIYPLGDIVISVDTAQRQAQEFEHSLTREITYLFVHSLFHLMGYDHMDDLEKQEMRMKEEKVLAHHGLSR